VGASNADQIT